MAELLEKLSQKLDPQAPPAADAAEERRPGIAGPNRDRLTVGVDLGDKWSNYCILGLDGEKSCHRIRWGGRGFLMRWKTPRDGSGWRFLTV
jgi:hypothetical protein